MGECPNERVPMYIIGTLYFFLKNFILRTGNWLIWQTLRNFQSSLKLTIYLVTPNLTAIKYLFFCSWVDYPIHRGITVTSWIASEPWILVWDPIFLGYQGDSYSYYVRFVDFSFSTFCSFPILCCICSSSSPFVCKKSFIYIFYTPFWCNLYRIL